MRIIIGADLVPTESNVELFNKGDVTSLVGNKIRKELEEADFRIFNLELALTDKQTPIRKAGPNISAPTSTIAGYKALQVDLLGISNNHILDHGYIGFVSTLNTLDDARIKHVGAGFTKEEAVKPVFFEKDGVKVGVYACCEHEFSWIEDYGFGANGFDPLDTLDEIAQAKAECDYLIVLYHGGKEHYAYPSPRLVKVCRKIVDNGADIVLCQHTHCVGTEEDYKGGKIIYGQGNFIFAKKYANVPTWGLGMLVRIDINAGEATKYNFIPYKSTDCGIEYDESGEVIDGLRKRSLEIKEDGFIEKSFEKLAEETVVSRYVQHILGHYPTEEETYKQLIGWFHFAECEVHHECLITGLRAKGKLGRFGEFQNLNEK